MTYDKIIITLGGIGLAGVVAWYFWFAEAKGKIISTVGEMQEVLITVKGGYSPDVIVVDAAKPVRLNFRREETALCSEQVLLPDFKKQATLTPFQTISLEFTPEKPGEYGFQCGMGMLRGKVIAR